MIGGTLRAFCAWCQREGGPAFLGEREPLDDESETHGVCRRHLQNILAALPSHSFLHRRAVHDRRRTDRRQPRGTSHALGYTTVRFGRVGGATSSGSAPIAS